MEPISFGKKRALLVKDSSRRMVILNTLRQYASVRLWEKSQPREPEEQYSRDTNPLNYETFQRLRQTPHLARFVPESRNKRGGVRECPEYFLFMTVLQGSGSRKVCCFIEKKVPLDRSKIFQIRFRFQDELFAGTLCSGVFLRTTEARAKERDDIIEGFASYFPKIRREVSAPVRKNNWMFLADDLWVHRGKDVPMSLSQRLVCLQDILGTEWFPDTRLDVCEFEVARYADYNSIEDFLRNERKYFPFSISDHKVTFVSTQGTPGMEEYRISLKDPLPKPSMNDSVIFRNGEWSVQGPPQITSNSPQIKPRSESFEKKMASLPPLSLSATQGSEKTEILRLQKSEFPDVYWVIHPRSRKNLGAARVRSLQESQALRDRFSETEKEYILLTCVFEEEFMKWRPVLKIKSVEVNVNV